MRILPVEAAMQNDGKRFSKSRVIFFEDEDREKVKAFLEEKGRFFDGGNREGFSPL